MHSVHRLHPLAKSCLGEVAVNPRANELSQPERRQAAGRWIHGLPNVHQPKTIQDDPSTDWITTSVTKLPICADPQRKPGNQSVRPAGDKGNSGNYWLDAPGLARNHLMG
eukprot:s203_g31.t1